MLIDGGEENPNTTLSFRQCIGGQQNSYILSAPDFRATNGPSLTDVSTLTQRHENEISTLMSVVELLTKRIEELENNSHRLTLTQEETKGIYDTKINSIENCVVENWKEMVTSFNNNCESATKLHHDLNSKIDTKVEEIDTLMETIKCRSEHDKLENEGNVKRMETFMNEMVTDLNSNFYIAKEKHEDMYSKLDTAVEEMETIKSRLEHEKVENAESVNEIVENVNKRIHK